MDSLKEITTNIFSDIPKNYEEYIKFNDIEEWPFRLTSETIISLKEELSEFEDANYLKECLESEIAINLSSLDDLETRRTEHEIYLMKYAHQMLNVDNILHPKPDKQIEDKKKAFEKLGEKVRMTSEEVASLRKFQDRESSTIHELNLKSVELYKYPGYDDLEFSDLPGSANVMRLIHTVLQNTKIPKKYRHVYKKIFFSEASVGIVYDLFWWIFLDYFKNDTDSEDKERLFARIALDFGILVLSLSDSLKDGFLQIYPEQISIVLYIAFFHAFPDSRRLFGPDFKQKIVNTCYLWMIGMHPLPNSFNLWHIDNIIFGKEKVPENKLHSKSNVPKVKSHHIGPAFIYSKGLFDYKGCCPLIYKFLQIHDIEPLVSSNYKCGHRLEVADVSETETYQSQVMCLKEKFDERKQTHERVTKEHEKDIQEMAKRRKDLEKRFEKLQNELNVSGSILDMRQSVDKFFKD